MTGVLDHTMIRVEDLQRSIDWYSSHLDYEEVGRWEAETFTNVFLQPPDASDQVAALELTYNHDGRSYAMGDAWGHFAVRVRDVQTAYEDLMDAGVADYRDPESCGGSYAFVKDPDGHEIELVERDHGPRWSLDHTMLRVEDADAAIGWWTRKFEYEQTRRWEADTFANYFMRPPEAQPAAMALELTYNYDDRTYELGDAWGHLAVETTHLEDTWATLMDRGATDYRDPESCGGRYAFTKDREGHEVELVTG